MSIDEIPAWRDNLNIPLLRKGVEWVEEQEALPVMTRQWMQDMWVTSEEDRVACLTGETGCGTAYCLAGWVAMQKYPELAEIDFAWVNGKYLRSSDVAAEELGLPGYGVAPEQYETSCLHKLFSPHNTAADIRRIAEELAGEKL